MNPPLDPFWSPFLRTAPPPRSRRRRIALVCYVREVQVLSFLPAPASAISPAISRLFRVQFAVTYSSFDIITTLSACSTSSRLSPLLSSFLPSPLSHRNRHITNDLSLVISRASSRFQRGASVVSPLAARIGFKRSIHRTALPNPTTRPSTEQSLGLFFSLANITLLGPVVRTLIM
ncbi:hypothetical protein PAXRUDRAFT_354314 [Paxillus rubicundulus Ve08.2h10]|uniref:Uncharacterized protein n=1 Tax=Paxillus rubicundulus Ve08.2h10 TaxID=930991 RepID=A0A0D0E404_9AGAM|nr:hypothetical protein PAXRUDRAFT_354314 [Paxillus rubicundulus Ve08.2h10]